MEQGKKQPWLEIIISVAVLFWVACCALAVIRYVNFYPTYVSFDQGIFNQVFWNSLQGRFFQSSLSSTESILVMQDRAVPEVFYQRLGQHFTPALLLWLPIYALFSSPIGLSVLQVTLVAIAGLVLYALARCYHPPRLSGFIALSYYLANAVIGPTLANFHDLCQIPLFGFGLLLALEKRRWGMFAILALLLLLVREDAGVVLFGVGAYLLVSRRYPWVGLGVCVASAGYVLLVTNSIMPLFSPDISRRFVVEQFGQFVDGQAASTLQVLGGILRNPQRLLIELVSPPDRTLGYLLGQWLPLAFIPAVSGSAWAIAGFPLLSNLMRQDVTALSLDLRYAITLIPGLFYGSILWWHHHRQLFQTKMRLFWIGCMAIALITTVAYNPNRALSFVIPDSFQPWVHTPLADQWQHAQIIRGFLHQIPRDASVSATTHIVPHLSSRREIVRFPETRLLNDQRQVIWMDYIILDLQQLKQYQIIFSDERRTLRRIVPVLDRLLRNQRYGLLGFEDGVLLLQRDVPSNQNALSAWTPYRAELEPILDQSTE